MVYERRGWGGRLCSTFSEREGRPAEGRRLHRKIFRGERAAENQEGEGKGRSAD